MQHHSIEGDSNIKFPDEAGDQISLPGNFEGANVDVTAFANKNRYLSKLVKGVQASDFAEARERALPPLTYILNCLSFEYDVPIEIYQIDVIDEPTNQQSFTVRLPFAVGILEELSMQIGMRQHAALYREGLNTTNELYSFLCFFKVIELLESARKREDNETSATGRKPKRKPIVAPKDDGDLATWLKTIYPPWYEWSGKGVVTAIPREARGAKYGTIAEKHLIPLRNKIAHGLLDQEGAIDVDDPVLRRDAKIWAPYCRTIARKLLLERFYAAHAG